jgi:acyl-CoA dehydrogenase
LWEHLARLALTGLAVPEDYGGAGYGSVEVGIVMEEAGAALLCAPYLSTVVLATTALLECDDEEARKAYLPGIVEGSLTATLVLGGEPGPRDPGVTAIRTARGWRLDGTVGQVLDGHTADLVLVPAGTAEDGAVFAVDGREQSLERVPQSTMDLTRKQARLTFEQTPARLIHAGGTLKARVLATAGALLAAEQLGGAQRAMEMAVEYAKLRMQFGRPIGSFQAIKHKCATMLLKVEGARSAAHHALWTADGSPAELPLAAAVAQIACWQAFYHCAEENILIHGGIGYTWEHPAHLYFKRAAAGRSTLGDPSAHREALAHLLGM